MPNSQGYTVLDADGNELPCDFYVLIETDKASPGTLRHYGHEVQRRAGSPRLTLHVLDLADTWEKNFKENT